MVDASWIDADTVSLIDAGVAREIRLHPRGDYRAVGVEIGGKLYDALVSRRKSERETGATSAMGAMGAMGAIRISAPMPGRIVRVLVAVGDRVSARQAVVVVEAMKMENELRSPRDGVVKEVLVVPGAAVESGAVLIVVDQQ
jgi:biotin carboxyl carrier protein